VGEVVPLLPADVVEGLEPAEPVEPILGPVRRAPSGDGEPLVEVPRLARHEIVLDDAHRVGVAVCGQGLPVVLVHGFTAEGILYAQTLSRLVRMGFKVVAIDVAGHGGSQQAALDALDA
jgi:alpha-beta hydrolase superfamily lysophospholipase